MEENILSRAVVNKVNYGGETYLRVYNIDEKEGNEGDFISLKFFHEIKPNVYLPFFYEKGVSQDLYDRLVTTDINEDTIVTPDDIKLFLMSLNLYIENTYDVVKSSVESMMPGYEMIIYKEYMGVFYVVLPLSGVLNMLYAMLNIWDIAKGNMSLETADEGTK